MVREKGLEPPRIAAQDPKSCVSTNSTTLALPFWQPDRKYLLKIEVPLYLLVPWKSRIQEDQQNKISYLRFIQRYLARDTVFPLF